MAGSLGEEEEWNMGPMKDLSLGVIQESGNAQLFQQDSKVLQAAATDTPLAVSSHWIRMT